jgi:hypothetical protein
MNQRVIAARATRADYGIYTVGKRTGRYAGFATPYAARNFA